VGQGAGLSGKQSALQRNPEACAELARLLAQLGDTERSNQLFQEGLGLLDERLLAAAAGAGSRLTVSEGECSDRKRCRILLS
jgi:hypothetical protein